MRGGLRSAVRGPRYVNAGRYKGENRMQPARKGKSFTVLSPQSSPLPYLLPLFIFMLIMVAYPIGRVIYLSFTQNILTRPDLGVSFIGLDNYRTLFGSQEFWRTFGRTSLWTSYSVAGKTLAGFGLAWILAKNIGFKKVYLFLLLIPWVTPLVVGSVSWRWVYDGQFGMLNWILMKIGVIHEPYVWLGHKTSAFFATGVTDIWHGLPFMVLIMLAGLQAIPEDLTESANIDGASAYDRLRYIVLPLMTPIIVVATTLSAIWTFNSFGVIWPMTRGGPVDATSTLIVEAYKKSFGAFDMGMGSAYAVVIFITLLLFTVLYKRLLDRQERH